MKIKCMVDKRLYSQKPIMDTQLIQIRMEQREIEIKELAEMLSSGASFKPALLSGIKSNTWISQQLFGIDFDKNTTIEKEIQRCKELNLFPVFGYKTFSHTNDFHKFRFVFCSKSEIKNVDSRNIIQKILLELFSNSDQQVGDSARLFYGGIELINFDYNNRIDEIEMMNEYKDIITIDMFKGVPNKEYSSLRYPLVQNDNVEYIKSLDYKNIQNVLNIKDTEIYINNDIELFSYFNNIDLEWFINKTGTFACIFDDHIDNSPSASIYITDDGTPIYKCFGCGKAYTIISLIEKLAKCRRSIAINFLKQVFHINYVKTEWQKEQIQMLVDNANYLDSEDFVITFPTLNKLIRTRKHHLQKLLLYFTQFINNEEITDGKVVVYGSYKKLMDVCGINENKRITLSQSITLFALLNLIEKLSEENIPSQYYEKSKYISECYNHPKIVGYYSFKEYGINLLEESEEIAKILKENNISIKGLSREYLMRTFPDGLLVDRIYPQYKKENKKGLSKASDNNMIQIANIIIKGIEENGFFIESDLKVHDSTWKQWKRSIQQILDENRLNKIIVNKEFRRLYNIPDEIKSNTSVIVKNS